MRDFHRINVRANAVNESNVYVIPPKHGKQIVIHSFTVVGGSAGGSLDFYPCRGAGETTVSQAAITAADTAFELTSDGTADQLSGVAVAAADFVLLKTDTRHPVHGSYQLVAIGSVGAGGAAYIDVDTTTDYDSETGIRAACALGNQAFIIWAEDVSTLPVGAETITREDYAFVGNKGYPVALKQTPNGATTHSIFGVAEYV